MILKGTPAPIQIEVFDADTAADPGTTTIGVTRADGTVLVAAGTATTGTGTQPRAFTLTTTHTAQVDVLKATWTTTNHGTLTTWHPVVGAFYIDLNTLRNAGDISDETRFTDAALAQARHWWNDVVDNYCKQSFIPRYSPNSEPEEHWITRSGTLVLGRPRVRTILSATLNGAAVDTTGWVPLRTGEVVTSTGEPPVYETGLLRIGYEHGHNYPDGELYSAGITAMRDHLLSNRSGRASRQTLLTNTLGTVRLAQPGERRATGIPEVDAVLNRRIGDIPF